MKSRSALHLTGVVTLLTALSLALTVVVFAEAEMPELGYPEGGGDLAKVENDAAPAPVGQLAGARVTVDLQPLGRLLVPEGGPRLTCWLDREPEGQGVSVPFEFVAGAAALPPGLVRSRSLRGRHLVRVDLPVAGAVSASQPTWRLVDLDETGHGELCIGPTLPVRGVVLDEHQQPIADARIWVSGHSTVTDPDGRFLVPAVHGGDGVILVATATGRANTMRRFTLTSGTGLEHRIVMEPGAELRVQHAARQGRGPRGRAFVMPAAVVDGGAGLSTAGLDTPFWWPVVSGEGLLDEDGSVLLRGLPVHAPLIVFVHQPESPPAAGVRIVTRSSLQRVLVQGAEAPVLTGRVVDGSGAALEGALVLAGESAPLAADRFALPVPAILLHNSFCLTDHEGRFHVAQRRVDRSRITVARRDHMSLELDVRASDGQLLRSLTLPPLPGLEAGPALLLRFAEEDRALEVRVTQAGNTLQGYQPWQAAHPFRVTLRESALMDVVITTRPLDGLATTVREFRDVAVSGAVELLQEH